jgi:hypothetical protein
MSAQQTNRLNHVILSHAKDLLSDSRQKQILDYLQDEILELKIAHR